MDKIALSVPVGKSAGLVVRTAGKRATLRANIIDQIIAWPDDISAPGLVSPAGVIEIQQEHIQVFRISEYLTSPKIGFALFDARWVVIVRVNRQRLGFLVEELIGWGRIMCCKTNSEGYSETENKVHSIRMSDRRLVSAELIDAGSIFKTDRMGKYFYV